MKKTNLFLTLGTALLLAPLTSTFAQSTWETVDNATPAGGRDIVADPDGNFIGLDLDYTTTSAITGVVRSSDHGATWQTVGSIGGYALDLAAASDGTLFACGNRSLTVSGRAFVWQSLDHGATWTTLDPSVGSAQTFLALDVAVGNSGDVYLCGYFSGGKNWAVRKGHPTSTGGFTWSTVDSQTFGWPQSVFVRPGAAGQPDEVLVAGGAFTIRRSLDGGATWTTLASPTSAYTSQSGYSLTVGANGSIYVTGRVTKTTTTQTKVGKKIVTTTTTEYGWLTRRSTNGGASWLDVDYVANAQPAYSSGLNVDAFGRVFTVGFSLSTPNTWLVRGSTDGGATWTTTDLFAPAGVTSAQAWGVTSDALGNVCVIGEINLGSSKTAPIRRLAAP